MDLDDAYINASYIPDAESFPPRWEACADTFRKRLSVSGHARLGLMYGHGTRQSLDLFLPQGTALGLVVFVHGGYWRSFDNSSWSHLAEGPLGRGWAVAMPSYDLCPRVRIADITRQVAQAVSAAAREIPGPVRLCGHSAGGHLVARMADPGILPDDIAGRIVRIMPISMLSDLAPLMRTSMNADLGIDDDEARRESPIHQPVPAMPVSIWVGADERPAFVEQSRALARAWSSDLVIEPGRHHFDVIDALTDPQSTMVDTLLS